MKRLVVSALIAVGLLTAAAPVASAWNPGTDCTHLRVFTDQYGHKYVICLD
jgi:hypothetical protein